MILSCVLGKCRSVTPSIFVCLQQNVGIIFCINGPAFLKEIKMDNSLLIPKECCHYSSSWDCPSWLFGFWRTTMMPLFRWLSWLRNEIVNSSFISGDYGLKKLFTFFFKPSQELIGHLHAYHFVFICKCAWVPNVQMCFYLVSTLPTLIFNTEASSFTNMRLLSRISTLARILRSTIMQRVLHSLSLSLSSLSEGFTPFEHSSSGDMFIQTDFRASEEFTMVGPLLQ